MPMQSAAKRIVEWLVKGGSISDDVREVHEFGLGKLLSNAINFIFVFCLGLLFEIPLQTLVFYVAFLLLRVYAGGYHADTQLRCFLISAGVMVPCLLVIKNQHIWNVPIVFYSLLVFSGATIVLISPVDSKNKVLDSLERKVYRCRLIKNLSIISAVAASLTMLSLYKYSSAVLCAIVLTTIMAIIGKAKFSLQIL